MELEDDPGDVLSAIQELEEEGDVMAALALAGGLGDLEDLDANLTVAEIADEAISLGDGIEESRVNFTALYTAGNLTLEIFPYCGADGELDVMNMVEYMSTWRGTRYWCDGVLTLAVGGVGFVGNIFSILILSSSKEMRKYSFNHMLLALALFDLLFVVCAVPTHALPALGLKHNWARGIKQNRIYAELYKFFFHPFTTISYSGSVFMTVGITIERYIAVCYPLRYKTFTAHCTPVVRAMYYIAPAVFFAVVLSLPKFVEVEVLMSESGRLQYATNFFRHDPAYATWIWGGVHPFLTTTVIPIIVICGLNFRVYSGIRAARLARTSSQPSNSRGEVNLAVVFVTVSATFFVCHLIRVFLSVEAIYRAPHLADCLAMNLAMNSSIMYVPPLGLVCAESISHILILTNSSANFIIYCTLSTHFQIFLRKLCSAPTTHTNSFHDGPTNNACVNGGLLLPKGGGRHGVSPPNGKSPAAAPGSTALTVIARVANGSNGGPVVATATAAANAVQSVEPATNSTDDANDDDETNAKTAARLLNGHADGQARDGCDCKGYARCGQGQGNCDCAAMPV